MTKENSLICKCGGFYSNEYNYLIHTQTKKHLRFVENGYIGSVDKIIDPESRRLYWRNYYKDHKEIWMNCPSRLKLSVN